MQGLRIRNSELTDLLSDREHIVVSDWFVAARHRIAAGWITPEGDWQRYYFPLEDPNLFMSFARLGSRGAPSDSSILRWVDKYGLLTQKYENKPTWWQEQKVDKGGPEWIVNQSPMRIEAFKTEVRRTYGLLTLYTQIRTKDWAAIQARADNPSSPIDQVLAQEIGLGSLYEMSLRALEQEPDPLDSKYSLHLRLGLYYARHALAKALADALIDVRLTPRVSEPHPLLDYSQWLSSPPKGLAQSWNCPDLLSAIYLQFYLLVTHNKPVHHCENPACGMPFPITRKGRRFCNATCRSNARHYRSN